MPYDTADLRSSLAANPPRRTPVAAAAATALSLDDVEPAEVLPGGTATWLVRSQSCVVAHSRARQGDTLVRSGQVDEYVLMTHDAEAHVVVTWQGERRDIRGEAVVVVPPGDSAVDVLADTALSRVLSTQSRDLVEAAANADAYDDPDANVADWAPWPDPPAGHHIRVYPLADVPVDPARFGRLFRCSTVMVNVFAAERGPRDPGRLSPHQHDDFEQISLCLDGDYVHHLRFPWTVDRREWRADQHVLVASPSVTVIPPTVIHTSEATGDTRHVLIDVFAPPRHDFSARPGWVLNADEYPVPDSR